VAMLARQGNLAPAQTPTASRRALGLIFAIMLLDVMGQLLLAPVAPYLVRRYSDSALMVTLLTVMYAAAQFVAAPLLGTLGDRYGRRRVLLVSVLGSVAGYVVFGLGGALWVLLLGRLIGGASGGNISCAAAYIIDISAPADRTKNLTLVGMAWGLGLILGPALGAVAGQVSLEAPAFAAAGLSLLSVSLGYFFLPESLPRELRKSAPLRASDLNPLVPIGRMARKPGLGRLLLVLCLFNLAFNGVNNTEPLFLIDKFAAQPWQLGLQMVLVGAALAVVQTVFVPPLVRRWGEKRVAAVCLLAQAALAPVTFLSPLFWLIYPVTVLSRSASGFVFPTLTTLQVNGVSPQEQGTLMGVSAALGSLMGILGPLWAGVAYDVILPGAPYWLGAAIYVAAAAVLGL